MNFRIVMYYVSMVVMIEGFFLALPTCVALIYGESTWWSFVAVMLACLLVGLLGLRLKPDNRELFAREGFMIVALGWIVMSLLGAMPFYISGEIPSFTDAMFETVSGFTTTGASILSEVEALSKGALFWRSFTHWIGGMGFLVFLIAILPLGGGEKMYIMKAESPGPSVSKFVPRVKDTAKILYLIYIGITVLEMIILACSGMKLFDSITLSFGTAGTGGFAVRNSGFADYTMFQQGTISIFMILFGVNFSVYFLILTKRIREIFKIDEVRWYFAIIIASTAYITWCIRDLFGSLFEAFHHALFQVGAIITTTGYATCDFDAWPSSPKTVLVLLMFIGACAGSTGGGMKVSRFVIMIKSIRKEIQYYIHPRSVRKVQVDGRTLEHDVARSVNVYLITYILLFVASLLLISVEGKSLVTNFTAVASAFNNIGPGLELVGPMANFGHFTNFSKFVLIFDMLAGRLEIFPMLILFTPKAWRQ